MSADETALFAGGCFWCMEQAFDEVEGVVSTTSGFTGGEEPNPTYAEVSSGKTGHVETVEVVFDPKRVSYEELLDVYWRNVDPTRNDGQFCDTGVQYRPVIFYLNEQQKKEAEASKEKLLKETKVQPILVDILPATQFYPAEEYHQNYHQKNPYRYKFYKYRCGRKQRLKELWGCVYLPAAMDYFGCCLG
ncbi:MAG: Peptide methionine sulfoxide reductase MsrA [Chlamydiales bacterium]|nr:Peptide methionine sulfoxide reductase MsrA [Chlamydiales bacterium]